MFQKIKPLIHKLHDEIVQLVRFILSNFVKPDEIPESSNELSGINLDDETICLGNKNTFIGSVTREILESLHKDDKKSFMQKVTIAYPGIFLGILPARQLARGLNSQGAISELRAPVLTYK